MNETFPFVCSNCGQIRDLMRLNPISTSSPTTDPRSDAIEPYQYFITNLPESEFSKEDIRDLYKSRWAVETGFLELKYTTGLQAVHARKMDAVKQEIWARLILCNLCSAALAYCEVNRPVPSKPPGLL